MIWFKNIMAYRLTKKWSGQMSSCKRAIDVMSISPLRTIGYAQVRLESTFKNSALLYFSNNKQILLVAHKEEKCCLRKW